MPWSDLGKPVENTEEKVSHIMECVLQFGGRRYFPANDKAINAYVAAVADIVWDRDEGSLKPEECPHFAIKRLIGNDTDWLFKRAFARFRHCPSPHELRAMYCQYFTPADGVMISEEIED